MSKGTRIIQGLQDAIDGNFCRMSMEGQTWERVDGIKKAKNAEAWAIGFEDKRGFNIHRVVWGRMLARAERRKGEQIRRATIYVEMKKTKQPQTPLPDHQLAVPSPAGGHSP